MEGDIGLFDDEKFSLSRPRLENDENFLLNCSWKLSHIPAQDHDGRSLSTSTEPSFGGLKRSENISVEPIRLTFFPTSNLRFLFGPFSSHLLTSQSSYDDTVPTSFWSDASVPEPYYRSAFSDPNLPAISFGTAPNFTEDPLLRTFQPSALFYGFDTMPSMHPISSLNEQVERLKQEPRFGAEDSSSQLSSDPMDMEPPVKRQRPEVDRRRRPANPSMSPKED